MAKRVWIGTIGLVVVMIALMLASVPGVGAAPAGVTCPSFSKSGLKYQWSTLGTGWTCSSAKPWVLKLVADPVKVGGLVPLHNGPAGYHCVAEAHKKGHASTGQCYKHTLALPKSGFDWFGS